MSFIHSVTFETYCRARSPKADSVETRKGFSGTRFSLAAAAICGCLGWPQAMQYQPYPLCTETAKVDSARTKVFIDDGFGIPPPYKEVRTYQYQPGSCLPSKMVGVYDYGDMPDNKTYTLRAGQKVVDYTERFENGATATGTEYYSAAGKLDSSYYRENVVDKVNGDYKFTRFQRFITSAKYELVQTFIAYDNDPLEFSQGDSIIANDSGKTVYSKGEYENRTTECVTRGKTFVCTPTKVTDKEGKLKITWFLNQNRPDSMQVALSDGSLYYSNVYFWSSRQSVNIPLRNPGGALHQASDIPKFYFDLRGRRSGLGHGAEAPAGGMAPGKFLFRE